MPLCTCAYKPNIVLSLEQGANADFTVAQQEIAAGSAPVDVQVFIRVDQRALEPDEQFLLRLETEDQLLLQNNEFLQDTITITIIDSDSKYYILPSLIVIVLLHTGDGSCSVCSLHDEKSQVRGL